MAYQGPDGGAISVDVPDLRQLLGDIKAFSPRLAREIRRDLRRSGDEIINDQIAILAGPLPSGVRKVGTRQGRDSLGRRRTLNVYEDRAVGRRRETLLRMHIAKGLKVRVVAGKTRQGVEVRSSGPKIDGYNMARVWQSKVFRHPVFGDTQTWTYQKGQPYFWKPAFDGRDAMRMRIDEALDRGLAELGRG